MPQKAKKKMVLIGLFVPMAKIKYKNPYITQRHIKIILSIIKNSLLFHRILCNNKELYAICKVFEYLKVGLEFVFLNVQALRRAFYPQTVISM